MQTFSNNVKREHINPRFDLIPYEGLEELAKRFELGANKYGDYSWQKGGDDFFKDVPNHMVTHLFNYLQKLDNGEDDDIENLAAVAWGAVALIWYEKHKDKGLVEGDLLKYR